MKFILFVEGHTENKCLQHFLKRWLDPRLSKPVGVKTVRFEGWRELVKDAQTKAELYLSESDVIAVIGLLDLYGPTFYPETLGSARERYAWAKPYMERKVEDPRFLQFFAVHEVEAWLLSDPSIFPNGVRDALRRESRQPEDINDQRPPARLLNELFRQHTKRDYKKVTRGRDLFSKLDPEVAYRKCPRLKELLDTMLLLSRQAEQ